MDVKLETGLTRQTGGRGAEWLVMPWHVSISEWDEKTHRFKKKQPAAD